MSPKARPDKEILELARVPDVARLLGVTQKTVRDLVKKGKLQAHRIPKRDGTIANSILYFTKNDILEYIQWKYGDEEEVNENGN